jgi:glycosyltransferase involved in cell wall biosynthesis
LKQSVVAHPLEMPLVLLAKPKLLIVGAFPREGVNVYGGIVTTCKTLLESEFPSKFRLVLVDTTQRSNPPPGFLVRMILAAKRLLVYSALLQKQSPDAVLLFTAIGASVVEKGTMAWLARLMSVPVFMFPRGGELIDIARRSPTRKLWNKFFLRGATHFLCQSETWQRFAVDEVGFNSDRTAIIHSWSATPDLLAVGSGRQKPAKNAQPQILFIGWLEREKGIFELLEACRDLSNKHLFSLVIAGRGHAEEAARNFVYHYNSQDQVRFIGWVEGRAKLDALASADILVLPSWAEGFPNVVIEAMAAKVAVIVSSVGSVPDLLTDRYEALLVPPKDKDAVREALRELISDETFRWELASRGNAFAKENFSTEKGTKKLESVILSAIDQR